MPYDYGRPWPSVKPSLSQLQTCILFAHFDEVIWLGVGTALLQWTWYLYRSLRRKLGVVSPRLMEAIAENDPNSRGNRFAQGYDADMAAGFSFDRSIRSSADVWAMFPSFIVAPVVILVAVLKTCIRRTCCCCFAGSNAPISVQNRAVMEEEIRKKMKQKDVEDVFEAWPKWPSYMEDDPSANRATTEAFDEPFEIQVHRGPGTSIRPAAPSIVSARPSLDPSVRPSLAPSARPSIAPSARPSIDPSARPSLATKLRVSRLDLNDTHDESYGYDITRQRIRYRKDSWGHKFRVMLTVHERLINDIVGCIVIPALVFIPLYLVSAKNRSYEVFPGRGGCRVSSNGAQSDWVRVVMLEVLNAVIAVVGLLLSILSILQFKKQHGALSFKMKSLTPSPAVLRLYKSTTVVKNIILLCVGLNMTSTLGRIAHLGLRATKFNPSAKQNRRGLQPLFRYADQDPDAVLFAMAMIFIVATYLSLTWTSLKNRRSVFFCCCSSRNDTAGDNDNDENFSFPNYPNPLRPSNAQRGSAAIRFPHLVAPRVDGAIVDEITLQRDSSIRVGVVQSSMVITIGHERQVNSEQDDLDSGPITEAESLSPFAVTGSGSLSPSFGVRDDAQSERRGSNGKGAISKVASPIGRAPVISKPSPAAQPECRSNNTASWLSSVPINADGALTAIPSTSSASFSALPLIPSTGFPVRYLTRSLPATPVCSPKLVPFKSSTRIVSPEPAYIQGPLPTIPDQPHPSSRSSGKNPSVVQGPPPRTVSNPPRDNLMVSLTAVGMNRARLASNDTSLQPYPSVGLYTRRRPSVTPIPASPLSPPNPDSTVRVPEEDATYDHVLKKLAAKNSSGPEVAAVDDVMVDSAIEGYKGSEEEDDYDEACEVVTMGAISLEGLVFDDPVTDYDSIHQTMMPTDDRAMLENIVHHALISATTPIRSTPNRRSMAMPSSSSSNTGRRSFSRGRRRPSVIYYNNNSPYGHASRAPSSRSRRCSEVRQSSTYFHLVSKGVNADDLYGEDDEQQQRQLESSCPRQSSIPSTPSTLSRCKKSSAGIPTTIFENKPTIPRPDSPTDSFP
ncbi:hypothetical protein BGX33_008267 [Mortierella sp. NVP41]|nr:hypothetical protein BGX33_008267 [Mortierella sp. NVP41]